MASLALFMRVLCHVMNTNIQGQNAFLHPLWDIQNFQAKIIITSLMFERPVATLNIRPLLFYGDKATAPRYALGLTKFFCLL